MSRAWIKWASTLAVGGVFILFAARQYQFVNHYSLNIMLNDQWDIYEPIFQNRNWWTLFNWQHGPHRQGVAFLITPLLAKWSNCNTKWDSFSISYTMIAACLLGLWLVIKCGARHPIVMLSVPMMYLTAREYTSFTDSSNLAHGAMPILLFTAICLAWFITNHWLRIAVISLLTFGSIFTGFGLFVGLLTPALLLLEAIQALQQKDKPHALAAITGILLCGISWALFSIGYVFDPSNPYFVFPHPRPIEYVWFVALMLSNFYGLADRTWYAIPAGLLITGFLFYICIIHARKFLRAGMLNQRPSVIIFLLASFALIFCFFTAFGRVSLNWHTASLSTRYVILMVPAGMAILLHMVTSKHPSRAIILPVLYAALIAPNALQLTDDDWQVITQDHVDPRIRWRNAYFATRDEDRANQIAHYELYLRPEMIKDRLHYLDQHHLNFFLDEPHPPSPASH